MRRDGFVVVVVDVRCCVRWSVRDLRPALETHVLDALDSKARGVTESPTPKFRNGECVSQSNAKKDNNGRTRNSTDGGENGVLKSK
jgi:hypothetical protein